eukprot:43770_1
MYWLMVPNYFTSIRYVFKTKLNPQIDATSNGILIWCTRIFIRSGSIRDAFWLVVRHSSLLKFTATLAMIWPIFVWLLCACCGVTVVVIVVSPINNINQHVSWHI